MNGNEKQRTRPQKLSGTEQNECVRSLARAKRVNGLRERVELVSEESGRGMARGLARGLALGSEDEENRQRPQK